MVIGVVTVDSSKLFISPIPNEEVYFVNLLMNNKMFSGKKKILNKF